MSIILNLHGNFFKLQVLPQIYTRSVTKPNLGPLAWCTASTDTKLWWRKVQSLLQGQARRMGSSCSKTLNSLMAFRKASLGVKVVGSLIMDILLIDWWWGDRVVFWESQSSIFFFQLVWGPCACGQHSVNLFHLVGVLVSVRQLKDMAQDTIYSSWGGTKGPWLCFMAQLLLFCLAWLFSFVSAFSHYSD